MTIPRSMSISVSSDESALVAAAVQDSENRTHSKVSLIINEGSEAPRCIGISRVQDRNDVFQPVLGRRIRDTFHRSSEFSESSRKYEISPPNTVLWTLCGKGET